MTRKLPRDPAVPPRAHTPTWKQSLTQKPSMSVHSSKGGANPHTSRDRRYADQGPLPAQFQEWPGGGQPACSCRLPGWALHPSGQQGTGWGPSAHPHTCPFVQHDIIATVWLLEPWLSLCWNASFIVAGLGPFPLAAGSPSPPA